MRFISNAIGFMLVARAVWCFFQSYGEYKVDSQIVRLLQSIAMILFAAVVMLFAAYF